jgi:hypothetical protein
MKLRELSFDEFIAGTNLPWNSMSKTHSNNPVLPLIIERSMRFPAKFIEISQNNESIAFIAGNQIGKKFVSLPFFSYGNVFIRPDENDRMNELFDLLVSNYGSVELRGFQAFSSRIYSGKVASWLNLSTHSDIQLEFFKGDLIRKIRKSQRAGLSHEIIFMNSSALIKNKVLTDFYRVYILNMKRLGSPHLSLDFFKEIFSSWENGIAYCIVLYSHGTAVGGAINLGYASFVENNWFATDYDYHALYPSYLLNWLLIEEAINHSYSIYSFGRSTRDSGVHKYKKQWGTYDVPLIWSYPDFYPEKPRNIPDLSRLWRNLPSFVTRLLGPMVARKIY